MPEEHPQRPCSPEQPRPVEGYGAAAAASGTPDRQLPSAASAAVPSQEDPEAAVAGCWKLLGGAPRPLWDWLQVAQSPSHPQRQTAASDRPLLQELVQRVSECPLVLQRFQEMVLQDVPRC